MAEQLPTFEELSKLPSLQLKSPPEIPLPSFADLKNLPDIPLKPEVINIGGQTSEHPAGTSFALTDIIKRAYGNGNDGVALTDLNWKVFSGTDTPGDRANIERLNKSTKREIPIDGWVQDSLRATAQAIPGLISLAEGAAVRAGEGALAGSAVGSVIPGIGTVAGFAGGATSGSIVGIAETMFKQTTADTFAEFRTMQNKAGKTLPEPIAKFGAVIAGAGIAGITFLPIGMLAKFVPGGATLLSRMGFKAGQAITVPTTKAAMKKFLFNMSKATAVFTGFGVAAEGNVIAARELTKSLAPGDFDRPGFLKIVNSLGDAAKESFKAAPLLAVGLTSPSLVVDVIRTRAKPTSKSAIRDHNIAQDLKSAQEATPIAQKISNADVSKDGKTLDIKLTQQEAKALDDVNIKVENGKISIKDAEIIVAEAQRVEVTNTIVVDLKATNIKDILSQETVFSDAVKIKAQEAIDKITSEKSPDIAEIIAATDSKTQSALQSLIQQVSETQVGQKIKAKARLNKLNTDISALDKTITEVDARITEREMSGKPTVQLSKKLDKLASQRDILEQERADIKLPKKQAPIDTKSHDILQPDLKGKDVTIKADQLDVLSARAATAAVRKGFREGLKTAKGDIKTAQTLLVKVLNDKKIPLKERGKFLTLVKNITSIEQLKKKLPAIESRIAKAIENTQRKGLISKISKLLRQSKAKIINNKKTSRFGAETQTQLTELITGFKEGKDALKNLNAIVKSSPALAEEALNARMQLLEPSIEDALINRVLDIASRPNDVPIAVIEKTLNDIKQLRESGAAERKLVVIKQRDKINEILQETEHAISQGVSVNILDDTTISGRILKNARDARSGYMGSTNTWDTLVDIAVNTKGTIAPRALEVLNLNAAFQVRKKIQMDWVKGYLDLGLEAYGFKTEKELGKRLVENSRIINLGLFNDLNGDPFLLKYSKDQAMKFVMERKDPTISDRYTSEKGNAFTPEMTQAIEGLLSAEDIAFADAQMAHYKTIIEKVNPVYEKLYGVSLENNPNYSPISVDLARHPAGRSTKDVGRQTEIDLKDNFFQEQANRRSFVKSALKVRGSSLPLAKTSASRAMMKHINDMAHFVAMGEKLRDVNAIIGNARIQLNIKKFHGSGVKDQMLSTLDDLNRGYLLEGAALDKWINTSNQMLAKSVIPGKVQIGIKQLSSIFSMSENIPVSAFLKGMTDFAVNPKKAVKTMYELSPLLRDRDSNPNLTIARLASKDNATLADLKSGNISKFLDASIKYGDLSPIYLGGWAQFKYWREQGLSPKQAMVKVEELIARTQQSGDLTQLTSLQRSGGFGRALSLFTSAPMAQLRQELRAIRQFHRGKITAREFGKRLAIYHLLIPLTYQTVASGFKPTEGEILRTAAFGSFNGMFIIGDLIHWAATKQFFPKTLPIFNVGKDILKGISDAATSTTTEEWMSSIRELSTAVGKLTGLQIGQGWNFIEGVDKVSKGKTKEGTKLIMGWPSSKAKR